MSNFGSYVKALRKASTHLTEEPFFFLLSTFISHKALQISVPLCCLIFYKEISALSLDNMSLDYEKYPIFSFENFAIFVTALLILAYAYYNIKENKDITSEENE